MVKFDKVTKPCIASSQMSPQILNAMQAIMLDPKNLDEMKSIAKNGSLAGSDAAVPYTHLTLPTISPVQILGVPVT